MCENQINKLLIDTLSCIDSLETIIEISLKQVPGKISFKTASRVQLDQANKLYTKYLNKGYVRYTFVQSMVLEDSAGDMHFMKKQEIKWFENKTISASEFPAFQSYF